MSLNKMMIIGNLGADPELRYTPSGKAVTNLRVAVNSNRRGPDGEWQEETLWLRVEVWDQAAERAAEQFRKGNKVYAEGELRAREYEGNDGQKRTSLELRFARVVNLERRPRDEDGGGGRRDLRRRAARGESPAALPSGPPRRAKRWTSTTFPSRHHRLPEERTDRWQAHDPAASRRTTTAIGAGARSATSASTRPSIDYKEVNRLRRYLTSERQDRARRKTGTCARHQRMLTVRPQAPRHVALLPYAPTAPARRSYSHDGWTSSS